MYQAKPFARPLWMCCAALSWGSVCAQVGVSSIELDTTLAALDDLSAIQVCVTSNVSKVWFISAPSLPVPINHPYHALISHIKSNVPESYQHRQVASLVEGRVAMVDFYDTLQGRPVGLPRILVYWAGAQGLLVEPEAATVKLFTELQGANVEYWPQDFIGHCGIIPLVYLAKYAATTGALKWEDSAAEFKLDYPFDTRMKPGDVSVRPPRQILTFRKAGTERLLEVSKIVGPGGAVMRQTIVRSRGSHSGRMLPERVEVQINLSEFPTVPRVDGTLGMLVDLEYHNAPILDGQCVVEALKTTGFFYADGGRLVATAVGGEALIRDAYLTLQSELPGHVPVDMATSQRLLDAALINSVSGRGEGLGWSDTRWPHLSEPALRELLSTDMKAFEPSSTYCGQMAVTLLMRLHGHQTTFGETLRDNPAPLISSEAIEILLAKAGLKYEAVRMSLGDAKGRVGEPFIIVLGANKERAHAGVAILQETGKFLVWSPPDNVEQVSIQAMESMAPLGICVVPHEWIPKDNTWFLLSIVVGTAVLLATAIWVWRIR